MPISLRRLYEATRTVNVRALDAAAHLKLLGCTLRTGTDGWIYARTAAGGEFAIRTLDCGTRFFASFAWPARGTMLQWLEFVNRANRSASFVTFVLSIDSDASYSVKAMAFVAGTYDTKAFATAFGMWQHDLDSLAQAPTPSDQSSEQIDSRRDLLVH